MQSRSHSKNICAVLYTAVATGQGMAKLWPWGVSLIIYHIISSRFTMAPPPIHSSEAPYNIIALVRINQIISHKTPS